MLGFFGQGIIQQTYRLERELTQEQQKNKWKFREKFFIYKKITQIKMIKTNNWLVGWLVILTIYTYKKRRKLFFENEFKKTNKKTVVLSMYAMQK